MAKHTLADEGTKQKNFSTIEAEIRSLISETGGAL